MKKFFLLILLTAAMAVTAAARQAPAPPVAQRDASPALSEQEGRARQAGDPRLPQIPAERPRAGKGFHNTFNGTLQIPVTRTVGSRKVIESYVTVECEDVVEDPETSDYFIYKMNTSGGNMQLDKLFRLIRRHHLAADDGNKYYTVMVNKVGNSFYCYADIYTYDSGNRSDYSSWSKKSVSVDEDLCGTDIAYDPTTGNIYGCLYTTGAEGYRWGTVDYNAKSSVTISSLSSPLMAVAVTLHGQYYGISDTGTLYSIDKTTGALTAIGETGLTLQYAGSGVINAQNNTMIVSFSNDNTNGIAEVDLATGASTILTTFGSDHQMTCLNITSAQANGEAPSAPQLSVSCANGSMTADVTITAPSTTYNGTPVAEGTEFTYTLEAEGNTISTGAIAAGATLQLAPAMSSTGMTKFSCWLSNDKGESPIVEASCFIGKGVPAAPGEVTLAITDGTSNLTWTPVTESSDGGYIDPAAVTYKVYDRNGDLVAENIAGTDYSAQLPELTSYTMFFYTVSAVYDGKESEGTTSNRVGAGTFEVPIHIDLTDSNIFDLHQVVDVNDDGKTWVYDSTDGARYNYSGSNPGDDWLISPALTLEAGKAYTFTVKARSHSSSYKERFEVFMGRECNVESLTTEILGPTVVDKTTYNNFEGVLRPEEDGLYYVGFHCISDKDRFRLYIKEYDINEGLPADYPDIVTDFQAVPDPTCAHYATITFNAPAQNIGHENLEGNLTVVLKRDNETIYTAEMAPGSPVSFTDEVPERGYYVYTAYVVHQDKEGIPVNSKIYIGPWPAMYPDNIVITEDPIGTVTVTWDPVTEDWNGNALLPENVTYNVYTVVNYGGGLEVGDKINTEPITGTSFSYTFESPEQQQDLILGVACCNREASSQVVPAIGLIGHYYNIPVRYTNEASLEQYYMGSRLDRHGTVGYGHGSNGVPAQDGDDTYFVINQFFAERSAMITGKIDLHQTENPYLSFFVFRQNDNDDNETRVRVIADGATTEIATIDNSTLTPGQWNRVQMSLADYKDKVVRIEIEANAHYYEATLYDNIQIREYIPKDLKASVAAPARVNAGEEFTVAVSVENLADTAASGYKVDLYQDSEIIYSKECGEDFAIEPGARIQFDVDRTLTLDDSTPAFKAVVTFDGDVDLDDNTSEEVAVERLVSTLPRVSGLAGVNSDLDNQLTWQVPDMTIPVPGIDTEDVEGAESFSDALEGWTFVDRDDLGIGGISGIDMPNHPTGSKASFFIFDQSHPSFNLSFLTHSGTKCLMTMFPYAGGTLDDWAISPLLPQGDNMLTFWARSYNDGYPETIEVWYSTTDSTNPSDFVKDESLGTITLPVDWQEMSTLLPEGVKRFAIRSCGTNSFMLMVDDIQFNMLHDWSDATLKGYNIYSENGRLNSEPVQESAYLHEGAASAPHTYKVSAVYEEGESEYSEPVYVAKSGVDATPGDGIRVSVEERTIVVSGAADRKVMIAGVDGKLLHAAIGDVSYETAPGVYAVVVGKYTVKVIVR